MIRFEELMSELSERMANDRCVPNKLMKEQVT